MSEQKIELVRTDLIVPLPYNICRMDSELDLMLREDMKLEHTGRYRIDPILLRRLTPEEIEQYKKQGKTNAQYQIVDGHSRWAAACELGWTCIRAIVTDMTLDEARELNYKKNKVRGTVDPMREAAYFRYLREVKGFTVDKMAEKFGINHREVERILSRVRVSPEAKTLLVGVTALSPLHYEIIGSVAEPEKQKALAEVVVKEELTTREAQLAKTAIEKGLPPEKTVKIVKTVKREKLKPKEARKVIEAIAQKPELAEKIVELPKPLLVEEAKKVTVPPEEPLKTAMKLKEYYPMLLIDYIYTRYKGEYLKDVIKASIFVVFWEKLTEKEREEAAQKAIKMAGEKGFEEPVIG